MNSYTGRATTASVINYHLPHHSVCINLTCTMLTPEQLTVVQQDSVELFQFSICSAHDSKSVHLHTTLMLKYDKFLTRTMVHRVTLTAG